MADQAYRRLLEHVAADLGDVVARVASDVHEPVETVRPAVVRIVDALLESDELTDRARIALADDGAQAAAAGVPLPALLDRYLSTGWVLLEAAARAAGSGASGGGDGSPEAVARLGAVLLKAGDSAAAALSDGYGRVERERAAAAATTRSEFLEEVLSLASGDAAGLARVTQRARELGIDADVARDVFVVAPGNGGERTTEGIGPPGSAGGGAQAPATTGGSRDRTDDFARRLVPPPRAGRAGAVDPLVAVRRGLLVVLAPPGARLEQRIRDAAQVSGSGSWIATCAAAGPGLGGVAAAYLDAVDALRAAEARGIADTVADARDLLLERALLASGDLARSAVDRILGPLRRPGRGGNDLVETLRVHLEHGQNLRATARALGIAPRTVSYRLSRAEHLLGHRLEGEAWTRIAAALFADRLLAGPPRSPRRAEPGPGRQAG